VARKAKLIKIEGSFEAVAKCVASGKKKKNSKRKKAVSQNSILKKSIL